MNDKLRERDIARKKEIKIQNLWKLVYGSFIERTWEDMDYCYYQRGDETTFGRFQCPSQDVRNRAIAMQKLQMWEQNFDEPKIVFTDLRSLVGNSIFDPLFDSTNDSWNLESCGSQIFDKHDYSVKPNVSTKRTSDGKLIRKAGLTILSNNGTIVGMLGTGELQVAAPLKKIMEELGLLTEITAGYINQQKSSYSRIQDIDLPKISVL